jgi:hypothetical protein
MAQISNYGDASWAYIEKNSEKSDGCGTFAKLSHWPNPLCFLGWLYE